MARRLLILSAVAVALVVLVAAATGDRGFFETRRRRGAYEALAREVAALESENAALTARIAALKSDPNVIEKLAREKLGYARPGEVIYLLPHTEALALPGGSPESR